MLRKSSRTYPRSAYPRTDPRERLRSAITEPSIGLTRCYGLPNIKTICYEINSIFRKWNSVDGLPGRTFAPVAILDGGTLAAGARKTRRSPAAVTRILGELEGAWACVWLNARRAGWPQPTPVCGLPHMRVGWFRTTRRRFVKRWVRRRFPRSAARLGAPGVRRRHIAPIITDFLDAYPELKAELMLSNRMIDLVEERVDVALRIGHLADSSLVARTLGHVRHVLVASPHYLARRGIPKELSHLAGHEIILQSTGDALPVWQFEVKGTGMVSIRPQGRLIVNQAETAIEAALAGRGLIRALSYQVAENVASGELERVLREFEPAPMPVSLLVTDTRFMPLRVRVFLDFAAKTLRDKGPRSSFAGKPAEHDFSSQVSAFHETLARQRRDGWMRSVSLARYAIGYGAVAAGGQARQFAQPEREATTMMVYVCSCYFLCRVRLLWGAYTVAIGEAGRWRRPYLGCSRRCLPSRRPTRRCSSAPSACAPPGGAGIDARPLLGPPCHAPPGALRELATGIMTAGADAGVRDAMAQEKTRPQALEQSVRELEDRYALTVSAPTTASGNGTWRAEQVDFSLRWRGLLGQMDARLGRIEIGRSCSAPRSARLSCCPREPSQG